MTSKTGTHETGTDALDRARLVRAETSVRLEELAPAIAGACEAMADRFVQGARLHPIGSGISAVDAAHVAVEFIHPVIAGKRALPALALTPADVTRAAPQSIILGIGLGDTPDLDRALGVARDRGCLTVALKSSGPRSSPVDGVADGDGVDHLIAAGIDDALVARELHVTTYHLLWELVHEFIEAEESTGHPPAEGLGHLYPFLYERGAGGSTDLTDRVVNSTRSKAREIAELRSRVLADEATRVETVASRIASAGTIWTFGNGGSSTDAQAMARLLGSTTLHGRPVAAHALTDDVATLSALANDVGFDVVFARMMRSLARRGDMAVGFSTSGSSANVLAGLEAAAELGLETIGFAGYDGGEMADFGAMDHLFVVPSASVHRIQEAQTTLVHVLVERARTLTATSGH